jgi:hypothetical protein
MADAPRLQKPWKSFQLISNKYKMITDYDERSPMMKNSEGDR